MAAMTSIALAAAAAVTVGATVHSVKQAKKAAGLKKSDALPDPAVERAKAETEAFQAANSRLAAKNRVRKASSLLAKPMDSTSSDVGSLGAAPGKTTLGQ